MTDSQSLSSWTGRQRDTQRLSRAEVERRLLEQAASLIEQHGLTVSLEHLRVDELMEMTGVPKTSFYRVWDSKEDFLIRVLEEVVKPDERGGAAFDPSTLDAVKDSIAAHPELVDSEDGVLRLFFEAIRVGADRNYWALRHGVKWKTYTAVQATLRSLPDGELQRRVEKAVIAAEQSFVSHMTSFYAEMLPLFGYRFREGVGPQHLAAAGAAVVEGLVQRSLVNEELAESRIPGPAIGGGTTAWSLAATGFLGVAQVLLERDPNWSLDDSKTALRAIADQRS